MLSDVVEDKPNCSMAMRLPAGRGRRQASADAELSASDRAQIIK
jgi:hypothetical protein